MSLMDKRTAVEAEMNAIIARLTQPGAPGLSGNLVDSEVFLFFLSFSLSFYLSQLAFPIMLLAVRSFRFCRNLLF